MTKKEIVKMNAVSPYLATNVAMPLFNGTYSENEQDFRIHSYEPYSDNRVNKALVMQLYSAMDNPTGIEVKSGQDIIVCVDQIPDGQTVSLAVYSEEDEYGPNYGGGGSNENVNQNTVLQAGVNTIRINADGMAYVMNTVPVENREPLSSFKSVKVHILPGCGTIQGYFDPARHTDERYKEILNRCTYKYFMVKGKKCLFLFHTNQLRSDFPNSIRGGINAWDNLVSWELELMGLDKVEWFNNHMMAVTSTNPDVYMNATNRRVQFNASTINWICDPDNLARVSRRFWVRPTKWVTSTRWPSTGVPRPSPPTTSSPTMPTTSTPATPSTRPAGLVATNWRNLQRTMPTRRRGPFSVTAATRVKIPVST